MEPIINAVRMAAAMPASIPYQGGISLNCIRIMIV
jgi:hypothetical protein